MAAVADVSERSPAAAIEVFLVMLRALGEVKTTETTFAAGGRDWPAIAFVLRPRLEAGKGLEGSLVAFEPGKGTTRVVLCGGGPADRAIAERCLDVLPLLAETGPAPFRVAPSRPTFLGRAVAIPEGCETVEATETAFTVQCGEAVALTAMLVSKPEEIPAIVGALSETLLRMPGATRGRDRACRIGGIPIQCRTVHIGEGPGRLVAYVGGADVDGKPVVVACRQLADENGLHPLCANSLTLLTATGGGKAGKP